MPPAGSADATKVNSLSLRALAAVDHIGMQVMVYVDTILELFGLAGESVLLAMQPSTWSYPVRQVLYRQILFTAVDAFLLAIRFSFALGVLTVVQIQTAEKMIPGTEALIQPLLSHGLVREMAPLIANLIVIGRSGSAMSIQTATAKLNRELEILESSGIALMKFWIMPRIISCAISVFFLAVIITVALPVMGQTIAVLLGFSSDSILDFGKIFLDLDEKDALFFFSKTVFLGLILGAVFIRTGLMVNDSPSAIPIVATRSGVLALTSYFALSAILSVVSYRSILAIDLGQFFE